MSSNAIAMNYRSGSYDANISGRKVLDTISSIVGKAYDVLTMPVFGKDYSSITGIDYQTQEHLRDRGFGSIGAYKQSLENGSFDNIAQENYSSLSFGERVATTVKRFVTSPLMPVTGSIQRNDKAVDAAMKFVAQYAAQNSGNIDGTKVYECMEAAGVNNGRTRKAATELAQKMYSVKGEVVDGTIVKDGVAGAISNFANNYLGLGHIGQGLQFYKKEGEGKLDTILRNSKIGGETQAIMTGAALASFGTGMLMYSAASSSAEAVKEQGGAVGTAGGAAGTLVNVGLTGMLVVGALASGNALYAARAANSVAGTGAKIGVKYANDDGLFSKANLVRAAKVTGLVGTAGMLAMIAPGNEAYAADEKVEEKKAEEPAPVKDAVKPVPSSEPASAATSTPVADYTLVDIAKIDAKLSNANITDSSVKYSLIENNNFIVDGAELPVTFKIMPVSGEAKYIQSADVNLDLGGLEKDLELTRGQYSIQIGTLSDATPGDNKFDMWSVSKEYKTEAITAPAADPAPVPEPTPAPADVKYHPIEADKVKIEGPADGNNHIKGFKFEHKPAADSLEVTVKGEGLEGTNPVFTLRADKDGNGLCEDKPNFYLQSEGLSAKFSGETHEGLKGFNFDKGVYSCDVGQLKDTNNDGIYEHNTLWATVNHSVKPVLTEPLPAMPVAPAPEPTPAPAAEPAAASNVERSLGYFYDESKVKGFSHDHVETKDFAFDKDYHKMISSIVYDKDSDSVDVRVADALKDQLIALNNDNDDSTRGLINLRVDVDNDPKERDFVNLYAEVGDDGVAHFSREQFEGLKKDHADFTYDLSKYDYRLTIKERADSQVGAVAFEDSDRFHGKADDDVYHKRYVSSVDSKQAMLDIKPESVRLPVSEPKPALETVPEPVAPEAVPEAVPESTVPAAKVGNADPMMDDLELLLSRAKLHSVVNGEIASGEGDPSMNQKQVNYRGDELKIEDGSFLRVAKGLTDIFPDDKIGSNAISNLQDYHKTDGVDVTQVVQGCIELGLNEQEVKEMATVISGVNGSEREYLDLGNGKVWATDIGVENFNTDHKGNGHK